MTRPWSPSPAHLFSKKPDSSHYDWSERWLSEQWRGEALTWKGIEHLIFKHNYIGERSNDQVNTSAMERCHCYSDLERNPASNFWTGFPIYKYVPKKTIRVIYHTDSWSLDQMILEIGVVDDPERVGFYSGVIESLFAIMSFIFGKLLYMIS